MKRIYMFLVVAMYLVISQEQGVQAQEQEEAGRHHDTFLSQEIEDVEKAYQSALLEGNLKQVDLIQARLDRLIEEKKVQEENQWIENQLQLMGSPLQVARLTLEGGSGTLAWPTQSRQVTSSFGMRFHPILKRSRLHQGIDIAGSGTVYSAADGVVTKCGRMGGYGNLIEVTHSSGLKTRYAHLKDRSFYVKLGEDVQQGQALAEMGSTGLSTGVHLHFEVYENGRVTNPLKFLK